MDLVPGSAGRAFGDEFGAHAADLRIERRDIEIGNPVEQTTVANELVECLGPCRRAPRRTSMKRCHLGRGLVAGDRLRHLIERRAGPAATDWPEMDRHTACWLAG